MKCSPHTCKVALSSHGTAGGGHPSPQVSSHGKGLILGSAPNDIIRLTAALHYFVILSFEDVKS